MEGLTCQEGKEENLQKNLNYKWWIGYNKLDKKDKDMLK